MQQRIALVGFGAIAQAVLELIQDEPLLELTHVIVRDGRQEQVAQKLPAAYVDAAIVSAVPLDDSRPDLVVECAGHGALSTHVFPALQAGIPCMVVSVGALSEPGVAEELEAAALAGGTQVHLLSGAIGGIDALAAAKHAGLDSVVYTGRKPPLGWLGSPAQDTLDLHNLGEPALFFEGTAREAARQFPKNANVAATLSFAGIGLDNTQVKLYADPGVSENIHHYEAQGAFGHMAVTLKGKPLASNPKTSALTVYSVVRALKNRVRPVVV